MCYGEFMTTDEPVLTLSHITPTVRGKKQELWLLGKALYTDSEKLAKACLKGKALIPIAWEDQDIRDITHTAILAIKVVERRSLQVEEIHVFEGKVRAMAGKLWGRRDSGWLPIEAEPGRQSPEGERHDTVNACPTQDHPTSEKPVLSSR